MTGAANSYLNVKKGIENIRSKGEKMLEFGTAVRSDVMIDLAAEVNKVIFDLLLLTDLPGDAKAGLRQRRRYGETAEQTEAGGA